LIRQLQDLLNRNIKKKRIYEKRQKMNGSIDDGFLNIKERVFERANSRVPKEIMLSSFLTKMKSTSKSCVNRKILVTEFFSCKRA